MTKKQTQYERMMAGKLYRGFDQEIGKIRTVGQTKKAALNAIPLDDAKARHAAMVNLLGSIGERCVVSEPFYVDFGCNVHLGNCFINMGATFLDANTITIGDRTLVGPHVQFLTSGHPVHPDERTPKFLAEGGIGADLPDDYEGSAYALPITIGKNCWIGGGAIIMAGITIGDGTTIGAGSVVTKDIPARCIAVGSPARVVRYFDE